MFLTRILDSSRVWPSNKTRLQCVDDYDSDLDGEGSGVGIPADAYPLPAWCVGLRFFSVQKPQTHFVLCSIPEDPLPTYNALAPALVLKSGAAKT